MKNTDVFTGLSWGNLDRYKARHELTLCKEQAAALDRRILEFSAGDHTYGWAVAALEFCNGEAAVSNKVLQHCREAYRLEDLKRTAQTVIKAENDRIAAENKAKAQALDNSIVALAAAERTSYWCTEILAVNRDVAALPREVRVLLTKLGQLEKLMHECEQLRLTEETERKVQNLLDAEPKGDTWLRSAEKYVKAKPGDGLIRPIKNKELLPALTREYWRVYRAPVVKQFTGILTQMEDGQWKQAALRSQFQSKDKDLKKLHFKIDDYVPNFTIRWNQARALVEAEETRLIAEQKEQERQAKIRADKADLQKYVVCLNKIEDGKASDPNLRNEYRQLAKQVLALKYNPDSYEDNFHVRWKAAADTVAAAQKVDDDAAAAARKAAQDKANREDLQRFVTCLKEIENNGAGKEQTRNNYDRLNTDLSKLSYEPNNYEDNFRARWKTAGLTVEQAKKDAQAAAEAAQRAKEQALAEQASKAIALEAKAARRDEVWLYFRWVFSMVATISLTFIGVNYASRFGIWWYTPVAVMLGALMYSRMWQQVKDDMYEYPHVLMQILFYLASIGIPLFFHQGILVMVVTAGLVALVFNLFPRFCETTSGGIAFLKTLCLPLLGILLLVSMENWLPGLIATNKWHMLWFCPVVCIGTIFLPTFSLYFDEDTALFSGLLIGIVLAVMFIIRSLAILFTFVAFSFGMFFFVVLLLAAVIVVGFIVLAICGFF